MVLKRSCIKGKGILVSYVSKKIAISFSDPLFTDVGVPVVMFTLYNSMFVIALPDQTLVSYFWSSDEASFDVIEP